MQDPGSFLDASGSLIPAATVQKLINRQLGTVEVAGKYQVVDTQLQLASILPGTPDPSDISLFAIPGTGVISHDTTRPVHRSLSLSLMDPSALGFTSFNFDPRKHFLKVSQTLTCAQAGISITVPLGYYKVWLPSSSLEPGQTIHTWDALDLTSWVADKPFMSPWVVNASYAGGYFQAVTDILHVDEIPISQGGLGQTPTGNPDAGPDIPTWMIDLPWPQNQPVPADIEFSPGDNRLDACNQLLDACNCYPLTMTSAGKLSTKQQQAFYVGSGLPAAGWDYSTLAEANIVEIPITRDFQAQGDFQVCNYVVVEGTNGTVSYRSELLNTNPDSLISTVNLHSLTGGPKTISRYERNDQLANQQMSDLRAELLLMLGASVPEQLSLSTLPNPLHEDYDLLKCQVVDKDGSVLVASDDTNLFLETAWMLSLDDPAGRMSHQIQRVQPL